MDQHRTSHVTATENDKPGTYKTITASEVRGGPQSFLYFRRKTLIGAVGIMVSAWFLAKVLVVFAPLTSAHTQCNASAQLPLLLDATADELAMGLAAGYFTSVDLVEVCYTKIYPNAQGTLVMIDSMTGVCRPRPRGQCHSTHGHGDQPRRMANRTGTRRGARDGQAAGVSSFLSGPSE